jgi:hypothetical protein
MWKITRFITLAFGLLACGAHARAWEPAPWTRTDTWWEASYAAVVAMDYTQSVQIVPSGRFERNPFLPKHPSNKTFQYVCLGSVLGHVGVSCLLPAKWRRPWQTVTLSLEVLAVGDNQFLAGLRVKF